MSQIAVIGDNEFVMGFGLIGIEKIIEAEKPDEVKNAFHNMMKPGIGVIVTNDKAVSKLDPATKRAVEGSITPIVVVLSEREVAQNNLRDMIKKAIGIDILAK